jgi:cytosol alanyl aminopeptidase
MTIVRSHPIGCAFTILALLLSASCGPEAPAHRGKPVAVPTGSATPQVVPSAPAPRADGRLPRGVLPRSYKLSFRIDPDAGEFLAQTEIRVAVHETTQHVILHAHGMVVESASALVGGKPIPATTELRLAAGARAAEELVATFAQPLPPGEHTLSFRSRAPWDSELSGMFRVTDGGKNAVFTQFEATAARRAFPCFDEPGFKTPFEISVRAPAALTVLGNGKERARRVEGTDQVVDFEPTPPLPTYLVAIAVGDFDIREAKGPGVPLRVISMKGKGHLSDTALEAARALTAWFEKYLDVPYAFGKLDLVAVPSFAGGAMENAGLITFREDGLLLDAQKAGNGARKYQASVIAHEIAHQWFGNLVTAGWWDDLWLNEGFASFVEDKATDSIRPAWALETEARRTQQRVMDTDALASARAVRQPVRSSEEAGEAFDGLTYTKGAAILAMLEGWLGKEAFQKGLQRYLKRHAFGSATSADFFAALGASSGKDIEAVAKGFLDAPGVPVLRAELACIGDKHEVRLRAEPWRPLGATLGTATAASPQSWTLPACVRTSASDVRCIELATTTPQVLAGAKCPRFVYTNAGQTGYYRVALREEGWRAVLSALPSFSPLERAGIISNLWAQVRAGDLDVAFVLSALTRFDNDDDHLVLLELTDVLRRMQLTVVADSDLGQFGKYVKARLAPRRARLDRAAKRDPEAAAVARRAALSTLLALSGDTDAKRVLGQTAGEYVKNGAATDLELLGSAMDLSFHDGNAQAFDDLRKRLKEASSPEARTLYLRALAGFDDPAMVNKLVDMLIQGELKQQEMRTVLRSTLGRAATRHVIEGVVRTRWNELRKVLPGGLGVELVSVVRAACTKEAEARVTTFMDVHAKEIPGTDRGYAEYREAVGLCVALREHAGPGVSAYLRTVAPPP